MTNVFFDFMHDEVGINTYEALRPVLPENWCVDVLPDSPDTTISQWANFLQKRQVDIFITTSTAITNVLRACNQLHIPSLLIHNHFDRLPKVGLPVDYIAVPSLKVKTCLGKMGWCANRTFVTGASWLERDVRPHASLGIKPSIAYVPGVISTAEDRVKEEAVIDTLKAMSQSATGSFTLQVVNHPRLSEAVVPVTPSFSYIMTMAEAHIIISSDPQTIVESVLANKKVLVNLSSAVPCPALSELVQEGGLMSFISTYQLQDVIQHVVTSTIDFSDKQMNYFLVNYMACVHDKKNRHRVKLIIDYILQTRCKLSNVEDLLYSSLSQQCPELVDPLHNIKQEVHKALQGSNRLPAEIVL